MAKLTPEEEESFEGTLQHYGIEPVCPFCDANLSLDDKIRALIVPERDSSGAWKVSTTTGEITRVVSLSCTRCFYMAFFHLEGIHVRP